MHIDISDKIRDNPSYLFHLPAGRQVRVTASKQQKIKLLLHQIFCLKDQHRFILPGIAWLIFTTVLLTLPVSAFPKQGWVINIPLLDKWIHIGLFSMMALLFCWAFYKMKFSAKWKQHFISIGTYCLVYGIVMEFIQKYFVPNRSFDIVDIAADGVGAAIGVLYSIKRFIKK